MSEIVEAALRLYLPALHKCEHLPPLPTFQSGGTLVDIAERDHLFELMEAR